MEIARVVHQFANVFDLKRWDRLAECLADSVLCDYTELRGSKQTLTRDEYVQLRRDALHHLNTQHLFTNLEITHSNNTAHCQCSALIMRSLEQRYFNTHAVYNFDLSFKDERWQIVAIKQSLLWNEGDASIHSGVSAAQ